MQKRGRPLSPAAQRQLQMLQGSTVTLTQVRRQLQSLTQQRDELESFLNTFEEKLQSVGDDAQMANLDLQNMLQKQQQTMQMMSNISKMLHDTAMALIRKIGN